jgi:ankyrin repeat protein
MAAMRRHAPAAALVVLAALLAGGSPGAQAQAEAKRAAQPAAPSVEVPPDTPLMRQRDALSAAIVRDDLPALRGLLRAGLDPNFNLDDLYRGRSHESPLTLAIFRGRLEAARLLLEAGADPNRPDGSGRRAIHEARSAQAIALLAESGAAIDARDRQGETALAAAAVRGDLPLVDWLRAAGARFEASGTDVLLGVVGSGRPDLLGPLLERGVDPRRPPTRAAWPLVDRGSTDAVRNLLARGADPGASDERGTLLAHALLRQRWEIAGLLVDAGASLQWPDQPDCRAGFRLCRSIQYAMLASFDAPTLARLKAGGLELDHVASDGNTALVAIFLDRPLRVASAGGKASLPPADNELRLRNLLGQGADPNRRARDGTPLMVAIGLADRPPQMATLVFEAGGRIEHDAPIPPAGRRPLPHGGSPAVATLADRAPNSLGELTGMSVGPVSWALLMGRPDIALRHLRRDGRIGQADRNLAYFAALTGQWDLLVAALGLGAPANASDRAGVTPLMLAADAGQPVAVRELLRAGARVNDRSTDRWPPPGESGGAAVIGGHPPSRPRLATGITALGAAKAGGHAPVARLLADAGGRE